MAESRETLKGRFKNLFNLNKDGTTRAAPTSGNKQSLISDEFWLDIGASTALELRFEKIKEATLLVESEILSDPVIKKLWIETKDLLQPNISQETRLFELAFVRSIIKGQYRRLGMLRAVFFQALKEHTIPEDGPAVIQTFEVLSDNGKDVELFEQEVGPLIVNWMKTMKGNVTLLCLLVNIIKFNSSYLDQEIVVNMLDLVCVLYNSPTSDDEKELGLQVVDAIICYSSLPHESLYTVTLMLCRILNLKKFCNESWKLMRKLLGTHLGHNCISTMCYILQNPKMLQDWSLLRSAIFFIGMGLWGSVRVKSLKHTAQSVLPSFYCALQTKNLELAFEVTLTIQRLVRKFGHELQVGAWDYVLDIVSSLLELVEENMITKPNLPATVSLKSGIHELITFIEKLIEGEAYDGSVERLYSITYGCSSDRPDESVFMLIMYKSQAINPTKQNWLPSLLTLMNSFYTNESRPAVRLKTLEILHSVTTSCMELYEEELVSEVYMNCFDDISMERDIPVKTKAVQLILHACKLANEKCSLLFSLMRSILDGDWIKRVLSGPSEASKEDSLSDIEELVLGLVDVFKQKMTRYPGTYAVEAFQLINTYIQCFYAPENISSCCELLVKSRREAFYLFLSLRANEQKQLCLKEFQNLDENPYTPYLLCELEDQDETGSGVGCISFEVVFECVLACLRKESWWPVLDTVFTELCGLLQNKAIVIESTTANTRLKYLEELSMTLCSLMSDSELARRKFVCLPKDFTRSNIQASVLSVLSCLVSYHRWLEINRQRQILRCLESGLISRCSRLCVASLTLCLVEMPRDSLLRVLPSMLLRLSQMSVTVHMATAVLELLATLAQLPGLYRNFVEDQYLIVFAVALQYTSPSKFSRYVVSLAHYVVGTWFAKCRMSFRPGFVKFITLHLHTVNRRGGQTETVDDIRNDLMETCIDMMARYTFSNCSAQPSRSPLAKFLFDKGPCATWLLGNKLITVTTSRVDVGSEKVFDSNDVVDPNKELFGSRLKPSLERQFSSEAPGKLQTSSFTTESPSSRQRHKSGGAVLRRSLNISPFELRSTNENPIYEATKKRLNLNDAGSGEPRSSDIQHILSQGWAEVYIRRPSGNTAWSMRIQNHLESTTDSNNLEDVLNLQSLLTEIKTRGEDGQKDTIEVPGPESKAQNEQPALEDRRRSNDYMDLISVRKPSLDSQEQKSDTADASDTNNSISTPVSRSGNEDIISRPHSNSSPPFIRHRSHTVSTSKNCAAEAAAVSAKRAVERKKSAYISNKGGHKSDLSSLTSSELSSGQPGKFQNDISSGSALNRYPGISSPCFVFLQLFQSAISTESIHRPILLPTNPVVERGIQVLDRIPPYDTWATGVVYVGLGEGSNGNEILANECGSPRYQNFLQGLGSLVNLTECDPASTFLSGLDTKGEDGDFTYVWKEDIAQMVFHVTTLMPNRSSDPGCKKRHIGNDYVIIAYDGDKGRYEPGCVVQGQFRSVEIIITPLDHSTNHVRYEFHKDCVSSAIGPATGPWLVSDPSLSVFVRQLALHANMAAFVCLGEGRGTGEYTSRSLARLKQIKRIRARALQEVDTTTASTSPTSKTVRDPTRDSGSLTRLEEFSDYVR